MSHPPPRSYSGRPGTPAARVSPGVLVGVSLWRLLIVVCAFTGFGAAVADFGLDSALPGLSQQASLLTGLVYLGLLAYPLFTGGRRHEPSSPWFCGALTVLLLLVAVTFMTLLGGALDNTGSLFEHVLTPLVVLVDWCVVGRNQAAVKWWYPLSWVLFPLAYLLYYLAAGLGMYGTFLDPDDSGFAGTVFGFFAAVVTVGYLLYGVGKLKAAATSAPPQQGTPQGHPYPQQYPQGHPYPQQYPPQGHPYPQQQYPQQGTPYPPQYAPTSPPPPQPGQQYPPYGQPPPQQ